MIAPAALSFSKQKGVRLAHPSLQIVEFTYSSSLSVAIILKNR